MTWPRVFFLLLLMVIPASLFFWWSEARREASRPPGTVASRGGEAFDLVLTRPDLHFSQADPSWGPLMLGGTRETIRSVGCTLWCTAMALRHFAIDTDPGRLNAALTSSGGFTPQGWLVWGGLEQVSGNRVKVSVYRQPDLAELDAHLRRGDLVTVKFFLPLGIPHWVLVVGKRGQDYLIQDPASRSADLIVLADRTPVIHSMRAISGTGGANPSSPVSGVTALRD